jgi:phosphoribosylglycinamide formyltransferase-1
MKRIVIFASGSGTNAENIIQFFQKTTFAEVVLVLANNKNAKVLDRATSNGVSALYFNKTAFKSNNILTILDAINPDLIVLAGFLLKINGELIARFPNKIVNIHPALLPKYGGKGMYGMHVHNAVVNNKEPETGITIHYVNEHYDEGHIIFQAKTAIETCDTPDSVAQKVQKLEQEHFPKIIASLLD